jgi:hypothetical protein
MATINTINLGNVVNDGLGDDLRTAFQKVNANFSALNSELTVSVGAASTQGVSLFKEKTGSQLTFKNLISGTKILIDDTGDTVIVNNTAPDAFIRIDTDSGTMLASSYQHIGFGGASANGSVTSRKDIEVSAFGSIISFKTAIPVTDILTSYDFGKIDGKYNNSMQAIYAASNMDFGTITLPGRFDLDCGTIV